MPWIIILALVASLLGGGTAYASGNALPGDALYPVKLAIEDARLLITEDAGEVLLNIEFLQTRMQEIQTLIEINREEDLNLVIDPFSERISSAAQSLEAVSRDDNERATQLALLLEQALSIHTEVLTSLLDTVPDEAKPAIEHAILTSGKGQDVVRSLFETRMPGGGPPDETPSPPVTLPVGSPPEESPGPPGEIPGLMITPPAGGPPEEIPGPPMTLPPSGPPEGIPVPNATQPVPIGPPTWVNPINPNVPSIRP